MMLSSHAFIFVLINYLKCDCRRIQHTRNYSYRQLHHAPTLRISRTALPSIFDGTIKYWNDTRILGDNEPDVRRVLSTINEPIQLVVRNRGSGTSANFIRYCKMVKESFVEWTGVPGLKVIAAKTNQAVGQIVGSIPYTITYMDREELESSKTSRDRSEPPLAAYVQNQRLQYVFPDRSSLTSTIRNLSEDTLQSWNPNNRTLELLDSTADNAYPISIVSNYIIRKNNISTSVDISAWTLRYMWWTLFSLESEEIFNATHFVSLRSSQASTLSLNILRGYTQNNQKLYNASICDMAADGVNPCVHGKCTTRLPFQSDDVKCVCEPGFQNLHYTDCREIQPVFASNDPMVIVQLILAGIAVIVITTIWGLVIFHRNHPKIRAISPVCCYVILGGCLCGGISIVGYAATPTDLVCRMRIFWPAAGFGAVFGMLLLKTYRIYTIFGYNRLKTSRGIRDIILVHLTLAITALEVLLSGLQILFSRPRGKDKAFDGALFTVCAAGERLEGVSVAMEIVVYACNAVLLVVALWLAVKTRGAFRRFAESKAIGMVIYVVTICVCMGLSANQRCRQYGPCRPLFHSRHRHTVDPVCETAWRGAWKSVRKYEAGIEE
ncbi:7 transmembrane sweet-taste receptor of 3 GCPR-domain-containing protein [Chytridium lagenaria]|nr:7 transmembrane sweet-taste receptor of 3 GCPR-domain-containing protein [Chytridium lagenaria]